MDKDEAKKKLAEDSAARAKAKEGKTAEGSKPTPTQEENDLAALGASPYPLEADGSPVEGAASNEMKTRQMEASGSGAGYQTRQSEGRRHTPPQHSSS